MPYDRNFELWATWVNSLKNEILYQQEGQKPSNPSVKIAATLTEDVVKNAQTSVVCKGTSLLA